MTTFSAEIANLPKVALHDHLDGGLRPDTIIELAAQVDHELPSTDAAALGQWFADNANAGSLVRYLETFDHTVAVMQTTEALSRVAREAVEDLAADGVILAELRYAPEQHLNRGLSLQQVVDAVAEGIRDGVELSRNAGRDIHVGTLLTAMRHADRAVEIARLALENRENGAVGFDIAGAELGFPARNHAEAFDLLHSEFFPATVHAGEADGVSSIADALHAGRASRIGHGLRIVEDITFDGGEPRLGRVAAWVRDQRIALELCPSSNIQTGAARDIASHPITILRDLGFEVTVNTDNRLMSGTSMSREMQLLVDQAHWTVTDLLHVTLAAVHHAFIPADVREQIIADHIIGRYEDSLTDATEW